MKIKLFFLLIFLPFAIVAQENDCAILEKAIKKIESDAAVQMLFDYTVYDDAGVEQFTDNGSLKLDGECYSLLLSPMKLWCDGSVQWSFMSQANEIYITEAGADESQAYNPVYLMGLYKKGYKCSSVRDAGNVVVTLSSTTNNEPYDRVILTLDDVNMRPKAMRVFMNGQGYVNIKINSYKPKCNFDKRVYKCPMEDFPSAEIVDMR